MMFRKIILPVVSLLMLGCASPKSQKNPYARINDCINEIREMQISALQEIHDTLVNTLPSQYEITRVIKGLNLDDLDVPNRNDYRNYVWVEVKNQNREYFITTMFQDQDFETGNMHHQVGRIQFWGNISHYSEKWCSTPNTPVGDGYHWIFNYDNSYDPLIKLYDEDYTAKAVVDSFVVFLRKSGETL